MSDEPLHIAWDGADGRRLAELRALFLERSEGGGPAPTQDYWTSERDLALYDATLGARIGWRWDAVLDEAARSGAEPATAPARTVVDLGCGTGVAVRAAWAAGWIAEGATVHCVDRSGLAARFAAERLAAVAPGLRALASNSPPSEPPALLLIGHLLLELDDRGHAWVLEQARRAGTTVWIEPGTRAAGRALSEVHEALRGDRVALAPCPHAGRCGLLEEGRAQDWCHHFPEPPPEAFTEPLPGKTAHELGLDVRSLATAYLVLGATRPAPESGVGRVLGRPKVEKGRARADLCTAEGVARVDLSKRSDPQLWRAWKRPGRERLLYRVDVDGSRLVSARAIEEGPSGPEGEPLIRPIRPEDDEAVAAVIRAVMPEFGATGDGFAITDPEVDGMHAAYGGDRATYFVVELEGRVVGGGGIAPLEGGSEDLCELRKMYFRPELRGRGLGRRLLERCLDAARALGFGRCYIETLTGMDAAMGLYESCGFRRLDAPLGTTGHHGCDRFYLLEL